MNEKRREKKLNKELRKINAGRSINKDILKISVGISVLFIAMALFLVYFLQVQASGVINNTYNKRSEEYRQKVIRGNIYADDGQELLAETRIGEDGSEYRIYPYGNLFAHVVGFDTKGGLGIESSYNYYLLSSNINILKKLENESKGLKSPGDGIVTTLDTGLQTKISEVLSSAGNAAAIALDPSTGEILSVVSKPDFNPNDISSIWDEITADENNSVLVNRATQGLYAPGSTFKVFTLDAYIREHPANYNQYDYYCTGEYIAGDMTLHCYNHSSHGRLDLKTSLAYSCNCSFANIGASLNLKQFQANNKRLYFNTNLPLDIPSAKSSYTMGTDASEQEIIQTVIGQGKTLVSPAHLAIIMSALANDGVLQKPHMVKQVVNSEGDIVRTFAPSREAELFEPAEASVLKEYLREVVVSGTAVNLSYGNYTAYGKTGTAETVSNFNLDTEAADHSWFAGWAEKDGRKLVVCVLIEKAQNTWASASQFSQEIFDYYFNR